MGELPLLREIISRNQWAESIGDKGDLFWCGPMLNVKNGIPNPDKWYNQFPALMRHCDKHSMGNSMNFMEKFYGEDFEISPKNYVMP